MDCERNPAQCLTLRNRSSSAAATNLPSRTKAAEESPWKALRPRMIMTEAALYFNRNYVDAVVNRINDLIVRGVFFNDNRNHNECVLLFENNYQGMGKVS